MTSPLGLFPAAPEIAGADASIGIYHITLGFSAWTWLCAAHVSARRAAGWMCERTKTFPWLTCDDCTRAAQS